MTDTQLTDLKKFIGDGFDQLRGEFSAQITESSTALRTEIAQLGDDLRSEMTTLGADLRAELRAELAEFRIELRTELRAEIHDLAIEFRSEMAQLRTDMSRRFSRQDEKLNEILTAIGERFDRNEKTIDGHDHRIARLEKRAA